LLELYPNFAFAPDDIHILIETPEKTFGRVCGACARRCDRATLHQLFTGYLVAEAGEIKLLRETSIRSRWRKRKCEWRRRYRPPGDEVHSF